jgi:hypothetical protein
MCIEEKLMEEIELSQENRDFLVAAQKLAAKIREASERVGYDLTAACTLVEGGNLTVHVNLPSDPEGVMGFVGLPSEVGLYLTANACGGLFPQPPVQKSS